MSLVLAACTVPALHRSAATSKLLHDAGAERRRKIAVLKQHPFCIYGDLVHVNLCGYQLDHRAMIKLSEALTSGALAQCQRLGLAGNKIGDAGITAFAQAIKPVSEGGSGAMANLKVLGVDKNQIGDAGCTSLASACASGALAKLEHLFLYNNQIGDAGIASLANACDNAALASIFLIDLDNNEASEVGKKAMRDVAKARGFRVNLRVDPIV
jgi:hypothetical protein